MKKHEVIKLHNERGLVSKIDFLETLPKEVFEGNVIKFNIPSADKIGKTNNGEGVWGWVSVEDKSKHDDDEFRGEIPAILCNTPMNFGGILFWGTEVLIKCNGNMRPVISSDWVENNILGKEWYRQQN